MAIKWAIAIMSDRPNLLQRQSLGHLGSDSHRGTLLDFRLLLADHDRGRTILCDAQHLGTPDGDIGQREIAAFCRLLPRLVELDLVTRREPVLARNIDDDIVLDRAEHRLASHPA